MATQNLAPLSSSAFPQVFSSAIDQFVSRVATLCEMEDQAGYECGHPAVATEFETERPACVKCLGVGRG